MVKSLHFGGRQAPVNPDSSLISGTLGNSFFPPNFRGVFDPFIRILIESTIFEVAMRIEGDKPSKIRVHSAWHIKLA